jgi:hypothetical protein
VFGILDHTQLKSMKVTIIKAFLGLIPIASSMYRNARLMNSTHLRGELNYKALLINAKLGA